MEKRRRDTDGDTVRVPEELRARADALFREVRGYDPASFQESLSLICDVAADRLDPADSPTSDVRTTPVEGPTENDVLSRPSGETGSDSSSTPASPPSESLDADSDRIRAIDEVFPRDWDAEETVRSQLPQIVDAYLQNPENAVDHERRVEAAFRIVASEASVSPTDLRETLVTCLYGGAGISADLSEEFFREALASVEEVHERPPTGVRAAASDGGVASESGEFSVESLLTDETDDPTADCEGCGARTPVDDLETVIGPEDGSTVRLLCRRCADDE